MGRGYGAAVRRPGSALGLLPAGKAIRGCGHPLWYAPGHHRPVEGGAGHQGAF